MYTNSDYITLLNRTFKEYEQQQAILKEQYNNSNNK